MGEDNIVSQTQEKVRCQECGSILFHIKYKHNGIEKIAFRCPSPHGLRNKKEFPMLDVVSIEELEDI